MKSFVHDLKYAWNKPDSGLVRLIIINVLVYVVTGLIYTICRISEQTAFYDQYIFDNLALSPRFPEFITHPWTLFTYFFNHSLGDFLHILFNMLVMYWFGGIFIEYAGSRRLVGLYFLGGILGGIVFLLAANFIPYYATLLHTSAGMIGASAAVYAIVVGAATLAPDYSIGLLFFGSVRIKYLAALYIFLSVLGSVGDNPGGNLAHLGGAFMGFLYIKVLQKNVDLARPLSAFYDLLIRLFTFRKPLQVSYRREPSFSVGKGKASSSRGGGKAVDQEQAIVDAILDKINDHGYERLTEEEKQILFRASQRKG